MLTIYLNSLLSQCDRIKPTPNVYELKSEASAKETALKGDRLANTFIVFLSRTQHLVGKPCQKHLGTLN